MAKASPLLRGLESRDSLKNLFYRSKANERRQQGVCSFWRVLVLAPDQLAQEIGTRRKATGMHREGNSERV